MASIESREMSTKTRKDVERGDAKGVERLLAEGQNPNARFTNGVVALMYAAGYGHVKAVEMLLNDPRVDVNLTDDKRRTALIHAVRNGNVKVVEMLLNDPRVDVNLTDSEGLTALMHAAERGNVEVVEMLLNDPRAGPNAVNILLEHIINTALKEQETNFAFNPNDIEIVALLLLKKGADTNERIIDWIAAAPAVIDNATQWTMDITRTIEEIREHIQDSTQYRTAEGVGSLTAVCGGADIHSSVKSEARAAAAGVESLVSRSNTGALHHDREPGPLVAPVEDGPDATPPQPKGQSSGQGPAL